MDIKYSHCHAMLIYLTRAGLKEGEKKHTNSFQKEKLLFKILKKKKKDYAELMKIKSFRIFESLNQKKKINP